jgi:chromosomal replication initiation ATPase DnaA
MTPPMIKDIQRAVSEQSGVPMLDICSVRRGNGIVKDRDGPPLNDALSVQQRKATVKFRYIAMYLVRKMTSRTYPDIAYYFGLRDHSTVLRACSMVTKQEEWLAWASECETAIACVELPGVFPWRHTDG